MSSAVLEVLHAAPLATVQDGGRPGFRRFGIPPAGAMDREAFHLANRLLGNREETSVLECLQGTRFRALKAVQLALTGYGHALAWRAEVGDIIEILPSLPGVWHMLALPGGIESFQWLGSASVCLRAGLGTPLRRGEQVSCLGDPLSGWPAGIGRRYPSESRNLTADPIRVRPGPQWSGFSHEARKAFVSQAWKVSQHCDRSGYRLEGMPLAVMPESLISEPIRIGAIQVPPNGQPIVCLYDGPTVGGYAKIAVVDADDLDRLVQNSPGTHVRFQMMT